MSIHSTAIIHPQAQLGLDVEVGPYAVVGSGVRVADGTKIGAHAVIEGQTDIGEGCVLGPFSAVGVAPQDLKYKGEQTRLVIGKRNVFREYVTISRGTLQGGGETMIGDDNYLMAYAHVAHDCILTHHIVMANGATLGGHVTIEEHAIIGGLVGVHQFTRIGGYAIVGGCATVIQDVPPYCRVAGNPARLHGLNAVGLKRHGIPAPHVSALKGAYRLFFRLGMLRQEAAAQVRHQWGDITEVMRLTQFIEQKTRRGVCR